MMDLVFVGTDRRLLRGSSAGLVRFCAELMRREAGHELGLLAERRRRAASSSSTSSSRCSSRSSSNDHARAGCSSSCTSSSCCCSRSRSAATWPRSTRAARCARSASAAGSSGSSIACGGVDPAREMSWIDYALAMLLFNLLGALVVYALQRLQAVAAAQSAGPGGGEPRLVVQHGDELRDQHELAGLRRRDDDELPHADARARRAELRLRRDRHGGARRADPRLRPQGRRRRSATSGSTSRARRSTSCCRCRSCSRSCS